MAYGLETGNNNNNNNNKPGPQAKKRKKYQGVQSGGYPKKPRVGHPWSTKLKEFFRNFLLMYIIPLYVTYLIIVNVTGKP